MGIRISYFGLKVKRFFKIPVFADSCSIIKYLLKMRKKELTNHADYVITSFMSEPLKQGLQEHKDRYLPYRILAYLLYGYHEWLRELPEGSLELKTGPLSRRMRVTSARLIDALEWLDTYKLVQIEERRKGYCRLRVQKPTRVLGGF